MEEKTAKSDVRDAQQNNISLLESMLMKLMRPKKHPNRTFKAHERPDATSHSVFYHSPGLESEERKANEDGNDLDSTVRSDGDEELPTRSLKTEDCNEGVEEFRGPPDEFYKCESFPTDSLSMQTQASESSQGPKEGELLEDKNNKEPSVEEHTPGVASLLNNPCQQSFAHTSHLSMSSERCDTTQMELKHEQPDDGPSKTVGMDTSSDQTAVNVSSRTTRSASDPVTQKRKEERPLSAPSISNLQEYETMANTMKKSKKAAMVLGWEDSGMSFGGMEQENSLAKIQKKGVKNKMKNLHKFMEKLKEKHDIKDADSKDIQSMEEAKCMKAPEVPPPLPPKKGRHLFLARTFTLKDFKLNLDPINLMDDIFTGNEWLLPSKTSPAEKDTSDQPMAYDVLQTEKYTQLNIPQLTPQQDQSEDTKNYQDHVSDAQPENVEKTNSDLDANTFAIPKTLLTNNTIQEMVSEIDCAPKKSDIYECLHMYIIPKNDLPLIKRKSLDASLMDFSAVKSSDLLDNSALKSRIRLSKKRHHSPPKKVKKEKPKAIFYKIPGDFLNESPVSASLPFNSIQFSKSPPHHSPLFPDHT